MPPRLWPLGLSRHTKRPLCRFSSSGRVIREHDVIVLRQRGPKEPKFHLSPPLRKDTPFKLSFGATVNGSDIIGKSFADFVTDTHGRKVRLQEVTMAQYLTNSVRVATPIYPQDANLIVSFLGISLPNAGEDPDADAGPPFEIFEAGTGMGSLTMHLARAIHGANPPVPPRLREALCAAPYERNTLPRRIVASDEDAREHSDSPHALALGDDPEAAALYEAHRAARRAIVHTLDVNPSSSRLAHGLVRNFRRAQYLLDVDFHVSTINAYLSSRLERSGGEPFLAHAVLDLPAAHENAAAVVDSLLPNGKLVVFCPSVTQILDFVVWVKDSQQMLVLDRVVELDTSTMEGDAGFRDGLGGRHWDVKVVDIRKAVRAGESGDDARGFVCRPKVGTLVIGGGFLAVFNKVARAVARDAVEDVQGEES